MSPLVIESMATILLQHVLSGIQTSGTRCGNRHLWKVLAQSAHARGIHGSLCPPLTLRSLKLLGQTLMWVIMVFVYKPLWAQTAPIASTYDIRLARQESPSLLSGAVVLDRGHRIALLGRGMAGGILTMHETRRGQTLATVAIEDRCSSSQLLAEPDGTHFALINSEGRICRFTADGALAVIVPHPMERPISAVFSRDGSLMALGNADGDLALLEWPSGRVRWHRALPRPRTYVIDMGFTADAHALVICCGEHAHPKKGTVALVDVETGQVIRRKSGNGTALAVSPDGCSVALLGNRLQVLSLPDLKPLWDAPTLLKSGTHLTPPVGFITRSTLLHHVDDGWYFVNAQKQLLHAKKGSYTSILIPTAGPALLAEQRFGPPAWVTESDLHINGQIVALPAPLTTNPPRVALSSNMRWLLMSNGHRFQRFDLLRGYSSKFNSNTGFEPTTVGVNNQGNISSRNGLTKVTYLNRELSDRPKQVLVLSNNGDTVLANFKDGLHWRNVATGRTMTLPNLAEPLASHLDALLFKAPDGSTHCVNADLGTDRVLPVNPNSWDSIRFTPDGRNVALEFRDGKHEFMTVELWSCDSGNKTASLKVASRGIPWTAGEFVMASNSTLLLKNSTPNQESFGKWFLGNLITEELRQIPADLGRVVVVAEGRVIGVMPDQTVRITELATGQLLATLSLQDEDNWLVIGPDGRFDTSRLQDNGAIRWILPDRPLEPVAMEAFYRDRYEPNLLAKIWRAEKLPPLPPLQTRNLDRPIVSILSIHLVARDLVDVEVEVTSPGKADARQLRLARDGVLVGSLANWPATSQAPYRHVFRGVHLPAASHTGNGTSTTTLSAWAFNADSVRGDTATKTLTRSISTTPVTSSAFLLTIGINWHENSTWNLSYAVNDAQTLAKTLTGALGSRGMQVFSTSVLSAGPDQARATKATIRDTLLYLSGQTPMDMPKPESMQGWPRPRPDDLVIITFAGHGFATQEGQYFLVPQDIGSGNIRSTDAAVQARAISMNELYQWVEGLDAKVAIVLDACNSANAINSAGFRPGPGEAHTLGQLAYDKGITLLAAAAGDQSALEINSLKHGLMTWILVEEGLDGGKADAEPLDQRITLREWLRYAVARTPEMAAELIRGVKLGGRGLILPGGLSQLRSDTALQQPVLFDYGNSDVILK